MKVAPQTTEKSSLLRGPGSHEHPHEPTYAQRRRARHGWAWAVFAAICFGTLIHGVVHHHGGYKLWEEDSDSAVKQVLKSTPVIVSLQSIVIMLLFCLMFAYVV